jgi:MFS family permease
VASLACGLADSQAMLIAARFAQGAGGAMASAVSLGMIVRLFPDPPGRQKALGIYSFTGAGGASIGLVLGGVLTQTLSWHWIFFVNVPLGVVAAVAGAYVLEDHAGLGLRAGADVLGALLVTAGLMSGVYTIVETASAGWGSARTGAGFAAAVLLLTGFAVRQARARTPLLPLRLLRSRNVSGANAVQLLTVAAAFGFQVLIPQYMQHILGYHAAAAGLAMLPAAVVIGFVSVVLSARLTGRFGLRAMLVSGLVPIAVGLGLLVRLPAHGSYALYLLPTMLLVGGFGLAFPAIITLAMSGSDGSDAGVVSGLVNSTQQVGAALGVAVLSTLVASHPGVAGYHLAFGTGAGLVVVALVLGAGGLSSRPAGRPDPVVPDQVSLPIVGL